MFNHKELNIPTILKQFRIPIENSLMTYTSIQQHHFTTSLTDSKFGGLPYLPLTAHYPKDDDGHDMMLLAQINLKDAQLEAPFPSEGMLQFFISPYLYEYTKQNPNIAEEKNLFYIRYFPYLLEEREIETKFDFLQIEPANYFPIKYCRSLTFEKKQEPVNATDYRLYTYMNQTSLEQIADEDGRTYEEIYLEHYQGAEHKLSGYPYFLHEDIRLASLPHRSYDTLLLQIISDDEDGIHWGDMGVIKFFINKQDLQNLDFSNVYLHVEDYS